MDILNYLPDQNNNIIILSIMLILVGIIPLIYEWFINKLDIFNLKNIFIINYIFQLGVYSILLVVNKESFIPWIFDDKYYIMMGIIYSIIGLLSFYLGYYGNFHFTKKKKYIKFIPWKRNRIKIILISTFIIGMISTYFLIFQKVGLSIFIESATRWRSVGSSGEGHLIIGATALLYSGALILIIYNIENIRNIVHLIKYTTIFIISILPTVTMGSRFNIMIPIVQVIIVYNYKINKIKLRKLVYIFVILNMILFYYGLMRENITKQRSLSSDTFTITEGSNKLVDTFNTIIGRSRGTEIVAIVIRKIDSGYDYKLFWKSILETISIIIPRAIWIEKPIPQMELFGREIMGDYLLWRDKGITTATGGFSPTCIGYLYWQLGLFGIIIGMFIFGKILKKIYAFLLIDTKNNSRIFLYSIYYIFAYYFAESPQDAINFLFIRLILAFILIKILTPKLVFDHRVKN